MSVRHIAVTWLALLPAWSQAAQDIDLTGKIATGKWALHYLRSGEFKPLRLKQKDEGISYACMEGNPRRQIHAWIHNIGCSVAQENLEGDVYTLQGLCRLKWWKSHAIPVSVELRPEHSKAFSLTIRTVNDALLGFEEHTSARHVGECDPSTESAAKRKQNQGTKG